MDPLVQDAVVRLSESMVRNTAGAVADRVQAAKARKGDAATIAELEELVSELLTDKNELVRVAKTFEQELVAQRLSTSDVEYIVTNVMPVVTRLVESGASESGQSSQVQEVLDLIEPILSIETVTVLQLIGFNFRKAIGEPLTNLVGRLLLSRVEADPALALEANKLVVERELAYLQVMQDPEAYARYMGAAGRGA